MTESAEYTPTLEDMRAVWVSHRAFNNFGKSFGKFWEAKANAEFDRWLETVRAEAKAEALREAAGEFQVNTWASVLTGGIVTRTRNGQEVSDWLRARANQYKENQS